MKWIEVAVVSLGEASGKVYQKTEAGTKKGIRQVNVNIYNQATGLVVSTVTESDGYFSYLGLVPGDYRIQVGDASLAKINMMSTEKSLFFTIQEKVEGDIVDNLEIELTELTKE